METLTTTKIQPHHLERRAGVYVRQSTPHQVRFNTASTELQYDLCARAASLGWPESRIEYYDGDLAVSGSVPSARQDFGQLVVDVGLGDVGIIFAFDATRLARNNTDWHRLLDICSVRDTLVADLDGIYDISLYNDRLVLGLKGTISEAEHHLIRTRLTQGMEKKAANGTLRKRLPIGLDYDDDGIVRLSPDERVRHAIELVFCKFHDLGTAHQVYRYLQAEDLQLPVRRYSWNEVRWQAPHYQAVVDILSNPRYAGAYVYGRTKQVRTVDAEGRIHVSRKEVPPAEWKVVLKDHHPGFIDWEQFEQNQRRLEKNQLMPSLGEASAVVRNGRGLLQGLIRCGVCGRRMATTYPAKGDSVRYACQKKMQSTEGQGVCQSVGGTRLEKAVVEAFLETVSTASMEIAVAALEELGAKEDAALQQLEDQLQEARYQADRARRQYDAIEPENRNVARTLESEWNERLTRVAEIEARIAERRHHKPAPLSDAERQRITELGVDVRKVWSAPTTAPRDKKQLLQAAFDAIFVLVDATSDARRARLTLAWQGGNTTEIEIPLPRPGQHSVVDPGQLVDDVRKMASCMIDTQIARALVARRVRTTTGLPFTAERVRRLRRRHDIEGFCPSDSEQEAAYTAQEAARELGVSMPTILRWLKEGFLDGVQVAPYAPWRIQLPPSVRLQTSEQTPEGWLSIRKAAHAVGESTRTVLHWVQSGKVDAMMGGRGRRRGLRINMASLNTSTQAMLFDAVSDRDTIVSSATPKSSSFSATSTPRRARSTQVPNDQQTGSR